MKALERVWHFWSSSLCYIHQGGGSKGIGKGCIYVPKYVHRMWTSFLQCASYLIAQAWIWRVFVPSLFYSSSLNPAAAVCLPLPDLKVTGLRFMAGICCESLSSVYLRMQRFELPPWAHSNPIPSAAEGSSQYTDDLEMSDMKKYDLKVE